MRLLSLLMMFLAGSIQAAHCQWDVQASGTIADLRGIHSVGQGIAWASGTDGTVLHTTDGGSDLQHCSRPPNVQMDANAPVRYAEPLKGETLFAASNSAAIAIGVLVPTALAQASASVQGSGTLELRAFQLPKGAQISGLEMHIVQGSFDGILGLPAGWHVLIENDASGYASLNVYAGSGAAPIDEKTFENMDLTVTKSDVETRRFDLWGSFTLVSASQKQRSIPFSSYSWEFVERYPRHRLYPHN